MTQDVAVTLMLEKEIMPNPLIPVEACPDIAKALERMWQVACEECIKKTKNKKPVQRLSLNGVVLEVYPSMTDAAKAYNVNKSTIFKVANGITPTAAGFKWRYAEVG